MAMTLRVVAVAGCAFGLTVMIGAVAILLVQAAPSIELPPQIAARAHWIASAFGALVVGGATALGLWASLELFPRKRLHPAWCFAVGLSLLPGAFLVSAFTEYLAAPHFVIATAIGGLGALALLAGLVSTIVYSQNRLLASAIVALVVAAMAGAGYVAFSAWTAPAASAP